MDGLEFLAAVVFFLIGYWLVDYLWPKQKSDPAPKPNVAAPPEKRDAP